MTATATIFVQTLATQLHLLGQSRINAMGDSLRSGSDFMSIGILVGVVIAVAAGIWFAARHFQLIDSGRVSCPIRLFRELCKAHELNWAERSLLRKLAHRRNLVSPAEIFVRPDCFDLDGAAVQGKVAQQVSDIHEKLFATS